MFIQGTIPVSAASLTEKTFLDNNKPRPNLILFGERIAQLSNTDHLPHKMETIDGKEINKRNFVKMPEHFSSRAAALTAFREGGLLICTGTKFSIGVGPKQKTYRVVCDENTEKLRIKRDDPAKKWGTKRMTHRFYDLPGGQPVRH